MKHVILYGHLAKKFGRHHRLDVRNPREAIQALRVNFPDFTAHVLKHNEPGYRVRVGREYRDEEGLSYPADDVIRIIPVVAGAGSLGKILLGATIMYLTMGMGSVLGSWAIGTGSATAVSAVSALSNLGMALVLGGVAQALFPIPAAQSTEPAENKPSYAFNGPVNTVTQGNPVPICYGELIVGSQVVSAALETGDIPL